MDAYLPAIVAVAVALITVLGNYYIGRVKNRTDVKTIANNASEALRDDLLALVDKYEKREESLVDKNDKLSTTVQELKEEVLALRAENRELKAEVQRLRKELEAFERIVYYIPSQDKPQTGE
jgi:predicted RNase H-like nuclease (RuvC/YqgF family)